MHGKRLCETQEAGDARRRLASRGRRRQGPSCAIGKAVVRCSARPNSKSSRASKVVRPDRRVRRRGDAGRGWAQTRAASMIWGRANSPHDVTVYLAEERILFTGDVLVQSPLPYTGASWPRAVDRGSARRSKRCR